MDNYTIASQYQVNLAQLMADIPRNAIDNGGFANRTAGEAPDKVFGLIMCYADQNWTDCQNCIRAAAAGIQQTCPFSLVARSCYDGCVLQYSNENFFSVANTTIAYYSVDAAPVNDTDSMEATRSKLMRRLAVEAAGSSLWWTNGNDRYTDSQGMLQELHGFTQCTRDLNASECIRCFKDFFPASAAGAIYGYSCYMRYSVASSLSGLHGQFSLPVVPYCSNTDNYTMASQYQVNLAQLMADLPRNAIDNGGFANRTAGKALDKVFGLIMCYADQNWTDCQNYIRAAAAGIQQTCPFSLVARSCYDGCVLQYSNENFFSVTNTTVAYYSVEAAPVNDTDSMEATRSKLMRRLTAEAAGSSLWWTNGNDRYTDSQGKLQELYGFTQCTRDLNATDPRLKDEQDSHEMQRVLIAGLWCAHPDRSLRPSIRQAMNVLRLEAPLPSLPTKMPIATFAPPDESLVSQSLSATTVSSGSS
ncbi:hypothetical protein ACQ4PT_054792 [Festuca glaucescens]